METSGVGTRMAIPSIFPFSSGSTSAVAFAAPVVVGIIDSAAARARRRSLCGQVEDVLIVRVRVHGGHEAVPEAERSCITFATGARQFVVQLAFEITSCFSGS
jgi:hypothetical protein